MSLSSRSPKLPHRSFRGQNLSHADFSGMDLCGVDFTDAILNGANFSYADLRGAIFRRSDLIGANLQFSRSGIAPQTQIILVVIWSIVTILAGTCAGFIGSATTGLLANESKVLAAYSHIPFVISWHALTGISVLCCSLIYGVWLRWKDLTTATMVTGSFIVGSGSILGAIVINACLRASQSWDVVGRMVLAIAGLATMLVFDLIFITIIVAIALELIRSTKRTIGVGAIGLIIVLWSILNTDSSMVVSFGAIAGASAIGYLGTIMASRARSQDKSDLLIGKIATYIATYAGTCFDRANLTDANFQSASLLNTNLSRANLTRTNFYGVSNINTAKLDRTILIAPLVRSLLISHWGYEGNYSGCNLAGAYLAGADLSDADFTGADLSDANLCDSCLERSNLTRIVGSGADLQGAKLTGACIADWSIDRTTLLAEINCDYIYLKAPGEERNPASGSFKTGDFTRLFQEIWNTVDLIFHHGIDWAAFSQAWQQIQIENAGVPLAIHSIEHKGAGTIVVKVEVPEELNKAELHSNFDRYYQLQLQAATERHHIELAGRDRELEIYREQQEKLQDILQSLVTTPANTATVERVVAIKVGARNSNGDFSISGEISDRGVAPLAAAVGALEREDRVTIAYRVWQIAYRQYLDGDVRIDIPDEQVTNLDRSAARAECRAAATHLKKQINNWLNSDLFKPIKELMLQELHPSQSIQVILQTDELNLRQLPFQLWDWFDRFPQSELTIASNIYRSISLQPPIEPTLKVLAIFGHSQGIDLSADRAAIANFPHPKIEFLVEPTRQILNDKLWESTWDTIFFAGHSSSNSSLSTGYLRINPVDKLTITELKSALERAISNGLKLAIVNSCNGLGIAAELMLLQLPQAIVMREPIPDAIAQKFLAYLTSALAEHKPLYLALREARDRLQGLETQYPCASWLPIVCQNPAECRKNTSVTP
jgi:uncharacterized protein YjbI with pentapeptide repeats